MTIDPVYVGIDVSKAHLDVFDPRRSKALRWNNDAGAIAELVATLAGCVVVVEATGAYDRSLRHALHRAGVAVARTNPGRARNFAKAARFLAKTDAIDARMLSLFGKRMQPDPEPAPERARETLALLNTRRDQLVAMRQQERVRLKEHPDPAVVANLAAHLQWLDESIAGLEREIASSIETDPALEADSRLMRSVPGVGPVVCATMLALMPEIGHRSPKTIAALSGLAPYNLDSGNYRGQRCIRGGRKRVRDALYMAAVSASRTKTRFGDFYRALRKAGKPPKLAFIALARKILTVLNAVIRQRAPFMA